MVGRDPLAVDDDAPGARDLSEPLAVPRGELIDDRADRRPVHVGGRRASQVPQGREEADVDGWHRRTEATAPAGAPGTLREVVAVIVLLSDRSLADALPAAPPEPDLKIEHLSVAGVDHVAGLAPDLVLVDGGENPGQAFAVLRAVRLRSATLPAVAIIERRDLERFAWEEVADELLFPGSSEAEIRVRLAILRRRTGSGAGTTIRLGPLVLDVDTYQVTAGGRALDLTFKEFELLRFLASRPGRVFTRPTLLREVWGYDFYGGTRTVDVHVRRLRSKLGPEHDYLIETIRGVGYRTADV